MKELGRTKGTVWDLQRLSTLDRVNKCYFVLLTETSLAILQEFESNEPSWKSRYAVQYAPGGFYLDLSGSDDALLHQAQEEIANQLGVDLMPCSFDEIVTAIENLTAQIGLINTSLQASISASLSLSGCCSPYGDPVPASAPAQGNPQLDPPPTGFPSWAAFFAYKCSAANKIADDWIDTLDNLQSLGGLIGAIAGIALGLFLNTTLLGGLLVGLMAIGFSAGTAAAIIVGLLIALVAGGVGLFGYFAALSASMEADKQSLVCDLYDSTSTQQAKQIVLDFTSSHALGLTYEPGDDAALFQATVSGMADALFNEAVTNSLFSLDTTVEGYVGDVDCDVCTPPNACVLFRTSQVAPYHTMEIGTIVGQSGGVTSSPESGWYFPTVNDYIEIACETAGLALVADAYQQYKGVGEQKLGSAPKNATIRMNFLEAYYNGAIPGNLAHVITTQSYPQQAGVWFLGGLDKDHVLDAGPVPGTIIFRIQGGLDGVSYLRKLVLQLYDPDIPGCTQYP